jgi:cell division protein FtsI (penicillin-binding protein 3)
VLGLDPRELERGLRERADKRFMWVKRLISDEQMAAFITVRDAKDMRAFVLTYEPQRQYLHGRLASHVVGFVGAEQHGFSGIEQTFDEVLSGKDGRRASTVDIHRRRIETQPDDYVAPVDGATVVLTIDVHIQQRVEQHLRNAVEDFTSAWGSAVVLDPRSGEVLALANYPDFSPDEPIPAGLSDAQRKAAEERLFDRAVAGAYEPGSVFKPFIVGPALQGGITHFGEVFKISGPVHQFGRRTIHDTHAYDALTIEQVISKSSNIGMAMLGERCGSARLHEYVERFGFGSRTGIELPGEHEGLLLPLQSWSGYSPQSIPIGQEIAVTPLQLVTAFAALASDGILYRPRVVRGVIGADGKLVEDRSEPIAVRRVLDEETARALRLKALVEVVRDGTGTKAAIDGFQVFGKTGTAQVARKDGRGYEPGKYMGSFIGGAPADHPRVVAVVSLYMPTGKSYYGGTIAAPAVGKILADVLAYMQVPPELPSSN